MDTLLLPITRREFFNAKNGYMVRKNFIFDGKELQIFITNRIIREGEVMGLLNRGISIIPINVSDLEWHNLDYRHSKKHIIEYDDLNIALMSTSEYNKWERSR